MSGFDTWSERSHAQEYLIYPNNIGPNLALDETSLSKGELYTFLTNKDNKGKKGSIVGIFKGTQSKQIISLIKEHIPINLRNTVKEVTLDMAGSMNKIVKRCFLKSEATTDRFHVQQLANSAVQELRIKYRWKVLNLENLVYRRAKADEEVYQPEILKNGDTLKQLIARSRYTLFKSKNNWTESQAVRAALLFQRYPDIEKAYGLANQLRRIYDQVIDPDVARIKLAKWFDKIEKSGFDSFNSIRRTFQVHHKQIINFFNNRSTNAFAESFNAKVKDFRRVFRDVVDIDFFLFRLTKIYA